LVVVVVFLVRVCLPNGLISLQAANEVFNRIGNRWVVPWSATTILKVSVSLKFHQSIIMKSFAFVYQFLAVKI
jgi:hypothetical protein